MPVSQFKAGDVSFPHRVARPVFNSDNAEEKFKSSSSQLRVKYVTGQYHRCIAAYTDINSNSSCLQPPTMAAFLPSSRPLLQKLLHTDSPYNQALILDPSLQSEDVEPFDTMTTNLTFCSQEEKVPDFHNL